MVVADIDIESARETACVAEIQTMAAHLRFKAEAVLIEQQASPTDPARGTTRGSIVNLASVSSFMAVPNMVQYTTCKHAIIGITKTAGEYIHQSEPHKKEARPDT